MRNKLQLLLVAIVTITLSVTTSCKKESSVLPQTTTDYTSTLKTHTDDGDRVSSEMDAISDDANAALQQAPGMSGGRVEGAGICDAVVSFDTVGNKKSITITYDGTSCDGRRYRKGTVVISLPAGVQWKDKGAVLTETINLKITRLSDNKSIVLNGTGTLTNVDGGLLKDLSLPGTIITHDLLTGVITITFDDGTARAWQIARKRVFNYDNGIVATISGTHTEGSNQHVTEWGTTRAGTPFATSISQPIVIRQDCQFRVVGGQLTHEKLARSASVTFGLDASGAPTTCPGAGKYYLKIDWTDVAGNSQSAILPY